MATSSDPLSLPLSGINLREAKKLPSHASEQGCGEGCHCKVYITSAGTVRQTSPPLYIFFITLNSLRGWGGMKTLTCCFTIFQTLIFGVPLNLFSFSLAWPYFVYFSVSSPFVWIPFLFFSMLFLPTVYISFHFLSCLHHLSTKFLIHLSSFPFKSSSSSL